MEETHVITNMTGQLERGGVYAHVAVCRSKCIYCDFYSCVMHSGFDWRRYLDTMLFELRGRRNELAGMRDITMYIGGGTPSLIPEELTEGFIKGMAAEIRSAVPSARIMETTLEVNPDDVTAERVRIWKRAGIDRISMGVQSLDDGVLRFIGRRHDASTALRAYEMLRSEFQNVSVDLMFGLPGQTLESLERTLEVFVAMQPQHISAYSLMYEERTALTRMRDCGRIEEADENLNVEMFEMINSCLRDAGYTRYEISNYALPGFESKHNSSYWEGIPYVGIGPSAHSFDGGRIRRWNVSDMEGYLKGVETGGTYYDTEVLNDAEVREERIMTGLRTSKGIDLDKFALRFGKEAEDQLIDRAGSFIGKGLLVLRDGSLRLTDAGVMVSDEIIVELF